MSLTPPHVDDQSSSGRPATPATRHPIYFIPGNELGDSDEVIERAVKAVERHLGECRDSQERDSRPASRGRL